MTCMPIWVLLFSFNHVVLTSCFSSVQVFFPRFSSTSFLPLFFFSLHPPHTSVLLSTPNTQQSCCTPCSSPPASPHHVPRRQQSPHHHQMQLPPPPNLQINNHNSPSQKSRLTTLLPYSADPVLCAAAFINSQFQFQQHRLQTCNSQFQYCPCSVP